MKTETAKRKKLPRSLKCLFWLAGALVVYTVMGFLVAPAVIKSQMLKRLPPMLHRPVALAEVKVNPYALSLTLRGLAVNETNGAPFAGLDQFYARLKFSSFFHRGWAVQEISLTHPFAGIVRAKDGSLNFDDIAAALNQPAPAPAPASKPASKSALPLVVIDSLHIDDANISVDDLAPPTPVKIKLLPIHLVLNHLSTDPKANNPYSFTAKSAAGETFAWDGLFSLQPPEVSGDFRITGLDLKEYSPYLAAFVSAGVTDGKLDVSAHYSASLGANGPDLSLTYGAVALSSLSVKSSTPDETVVTVPSLSIKLTEASLGKKLIHLALFKTSDGSLLARQNQDGTINLLSMLKPQPNSSPASGAPPPLVPAPANPPPATPAAASQIPWTVMVDEIAVDHYAVTVEDKKPARPAKFTLKDISFSATNFTTVSNAPLDVDVSAGWNDAGRLAARGAVRLQPPSADLVVDVAGLDLRPLQPYVEQQAKLAVGGGLFTLRGHAIYNPEGTSPTAAFQGDLGLTNFTTTDTIQFKDFVKLPGLAVNGIQFTFQPNKLDVREVKLSGLSTSIIMQTNHQINLLAVLPAKSAAVPSNATPPAAAPPAESAIRNPQSAMASNAPSPAAALDFPVTLGSFVIDKASFHFADLSIEPNCLFDVQEFDGSVKGLSSSPDARAAVDIRGKVDDVATFSVIGDVNPLSKDLLVNLAIDCKNMDLTPFTPYMEKFAGYPLQRGKLLVSLEPLDITRGQVVLSNHVVIAGLTLGAKNNSPDATKLPVKLGIALLKDRKGNIDLDVPIHGTLSDPQFKIMPIVWQVLGNLLSKAATAPFTLLGNLLGGGGEEMSYVDFQPGLPLITDSEQAKLAKLANALYERPALAVEVSAGADPVSEVPVLARLKLADQIRSLQAGELIAVGTPPETVQSLQVDPTNYTRLLKTLYLQTVGTNATNAAAPPASQAPANGPSATNAVASVGSVGSVGSVPSVPSLPSLPSVSSKSSSPTTVAQAPSSAFAKGGQLLERSASPAAPSAPSAPPASAKNPAPAAPAAKTAPAAAAATNTVPGAVPPPVAEPTQDEMEAALLAAIQVTSDDLRALMQARVRAVRAVLVNTGKVEAERVTTRSPQPISPDAHGQSRATLALQ
jgi:hypothetical protein